MTQKKWISFTVFSIGALWFLYGSSVIRADISPTPIETVTPTPSTATTYTPTPSTSATPTPTGTPTLTPTKTPTSTKSATKTPTPVATSLTPTTLIDEKVSPTETLTPSPSPIPDKNSNIPTLAYVFIGGGILLLSAVTALYLRNKKRYNSRE
jgi:hypothetical protein